MDAPLKKRLLNALHDAAKPSMPGAATPAGSWGAS